MAWVCHSNFCALACVHSCFPLDQAAQRRSPESKQLFTLPSCVHWLAQSFFLQTDPNILKLPQTRWRGPEREARGNGRSWCLSPVTKAPAALAPQCWRKPPQRVQVRPQLALRHASPGALHGSGRFTPGAGDSVEDRGVWATAAQSGRGPAGPSPAAVRDRAPDAGGVCSRRREAGVKGGWQSCRGPFPGGIRDPLPAPGLQKLRLFCG